MTLLLDFELFIGRFHPLVVHLPIGFIIIAVFFELISWWKKVDLRSAISYSLVLGAGFGCIAIALGFLLATDGGYDPDTLDLHKWTGIGTTALAFVAFLLHGRGRKHRKLEISYYLVLTSTVLLLGTAGHLGGNLTHGSTYLLEYAPETIRSMAGMEPKHVRVTNLDSAVIFLDVIHPIFESKCIVCHNSDKAKGGLLLMNQQTILKGGEGGPVIVPGDPKESELIRRISLDPNHEDFMPTEGRDPLTKEEAGLLVWWIEEGGPFDKKVSDMTLSPRVKALLEDQGIGKEKSFLAGLNLPGVDSTILDSIRSAGFKLKVISANSTLLEARYPTYGTDPISAEKLNKLRLAKDNVTWLTLSGTAMKDPTLAGIGAFKNLTRLDLNNTQVSDKGIAYLASLEHLESLNIYGTNISDKSIMNIQKMKGLKKLYVWQTNLSEKGIKSIKASSPQLEVIGGVESGQL